MLHCVIVKVTHVTKCSITIRVTVQGFWYVMFMLEAVSLLLLHAIC